MSYRNRVALLILADSLIVVCSIFAGRFILDTYITFEDTAILTSSITLLVFHHVFASWYKLYMKAWEYASVNELLAIFKSVTLSIVATAIVQEVVFHNILIRILLVTWLLHLFFIIGSRLSWRLFRDTYFEGKKDKKRTLIVGAGAAGVMVARQLSKSRDSELNPVIFIDDDTKKHHLQVMGLPVAGTIKDIHRCVASYKVEHIVIAIPSLSTKRLNEIYLECSATQIKTQMIPKIEDLMMGKVSVNHVRDVKVEDLLGRDPIELDMESISESITGETILVTGAGGSIGSEICRQVTKFSPKKLVLLGHGENSIYTIEMELRNKYPNGPEFVTEIADIQDKDKMVSVFGKHKPNVVYHAAAHKHVPLMERNPEEAVKNNVIGTKNVAEAADLAGVNTFVMVSSDKAVNPTNVMGATKKAAEMIVQYMGTISQTKFVAVRFGNVLGSRGSVIPLFKKQIAQGGPVTVTHPDMIRYFMTIPEASRLVIQAGSLARGGEIFVLDMGEPVKIVDLAKNVIKLSGYTEEDIEIKYTGIRPGEKLFEELLNSDEVHDKQVYPKIYIGKTANLYINEIQDVISNLASLPTDQLRDSLLGIANHNVKVKHEVVSS
ncbi:FlaA1/EpsC-like NDP-sugar epimerase [Scopulibacillus darangshiensis]|uniref:FlaA1/EpsC-like NDP-sugar epimerase n=1 Tax=Scopulibacillus darangshiensis TaxID=442528 RepID=A0A4R2NU65_9BACL|nr:nucleoside-diphosphate sugar epimerase/dehydratase [Scopulibacillus darangshiensis]TCP24925.1 FlaA1/EpsC-like NDP-sugar epimerase [Scopulibacillus darangshiensis]